MDVCPFIPVQDATMEDCVEVAKEFAERLAIELGVPGKEHLCVLVWLKDVNWVYLVKNTCMWLV